MPTALLAAALLQAATPPAMPEGAALAEAVSARSAALFDTFFEACDPAAFRGFLTADVEFYHDREGQVAASADDFVEAYRRNCESRAAPDAWRTRRALVAEGYEVHPVPGLGAIEEGDHLFYERRGDGPERLTGRAHFVHLWRLTPDGWRIARALSYDHGPAEE